MIAPPLSCNLSFIRWFVGIARRSLGLTPGYQIFVFKNGIGFGLEF